MSAIRRRFRVPVFSRLTLAWLSAFGVVAMVAGGVSLMLASGRGPGRVSLPVEQVEVLARVERPAANPDSPTYGVKLAAPGLRDGDAPAQRAETDAPEGENDILPYPDEFAAMEDDPEEGGDIVITIPGLEKPATAATVASLTRAPARAIPDPDPALLRATPFGKAPRIAENGRKPFAAYAHAFDNPDKKPEVALIVGGLGLNAALTERAIDELPASVSLAFAPYAKDLDFWTAKARQAGHEVILELPMEGYGGSPDALGAAGLLTSRTEQENLQRLDWLMSRFGGYFAVTNYLGAKFSSDPGAMGPVLDQLRQSGVAYIDDTGSALNGGALVSGVDAVIPPAPDASQRAIVRRDLERLEAIAQRNGAALGKTYAYAATIDELVAWSQNLEERDILAAPASSVLRSRRINR